MSAALGGTVWRILRISVRIDICGANRLVGEEVGSLQSTTSSNETTPLSYPVIPLHGLPCAIQSLRWSTKADRRAEHDPRGDSRCFNTPDIKAQVPFSHCHS